MKIFCFILVSFIQISIYSTEQFPDYLIIGSDTIYLKSFPLEVLELRNEPFGDIGFQSTACWRGYQAVWCIENNKLYPQTIKSCYPGKDTIDIIEYFINNDYEPTIENGKIFADWFSGKFINYFVPFPGTNLYSPIDDSDVDYYDIILRFEKGVLIQNRLH